VHWTAIRDSLRVEYALFLLRRPNGAARARALLDAMRPWVLTTRYLDLVRRVRGAQLTGARLWLITVHGRPRDGLAAPPPAAGFFRHYTVVAVTASDALALAADVEPEREWAHLQLDRYEVDRYEARETSGSQLAGVVHASGPVWYP
jgi:hypothetical protein